MPELSRIRAGEPPYVELPRSYNAAVDLLDRHVIEGRGDKVAVIDDDGRYTYAELAARAARAAGALQAMGVQPEQRVAIVMLDGVDYPAAFLGAIKLGAVPVLLNTMLTPQEYTYMLRDSRARAVIASASLYDKLRAAVTACPGIGVAVIGATTDAPSWRVLVEEAEPITHAAETTPDDVAFWLYSSGSTGTKAPAASWRATRRSGWKLMTPACWWMSIRWLTLKRCARRRPVWRRRHRTGEAVRNAPRRICSCFVS